MGKTDNNKQTYSALEVAKLCGVVNQTTINWIKNGYLSAFTTPGGQYRVYADDLLEFLQSRGIRVPKELKKLKQENEHNDNTILIVDKNEKVLDPNT